MIFVTATQRTLGRQLRVTLCRKRVMCKDIQSTFLGKNKKKTKNSLQRNVTSSFQKGKSMCEWYICIEKVNNFDSKSQMV